MGNYLMLLISSISYTIGLGLLTMSTPPVLANAMGTCGEYKPECIGQGQALPLIAFGMSGHLTLFNSFITEQVIQLEGDNIERFDKSTTYRMVFSILASIIFTFVAVIALPYIKPWSLRFGIPAICTLVATLLFISGSCSYTCFKPMGSPLTMFFRVFVAALLKLFHCCPKDSKKLYEIHSLFIYTVPHTRSLRCLNKAAIVIPTKPLEEQEKNMWRLCRVTEIEETKTIILMIPVWMTFILCGVVLALGFTFFIEQLEHLNPKVGRLKVPVVVLLWLYQQAQDQSSNLYAKLSNRLGRSGSRHLAPSLGIVISMILAILCCITAAKSENRRLSVVQIHGLVDKPDERVPVEN